jgi:hypothetical protein
MQLIHQYRILLRQRITLIYFHVLFYHSNQIHNNHQFLLLERKIVTYSYQLKKLCLKINEYLPVESSFIY